MLYVQLKSCLALLDPVTGPTRSMSRGVSSSRELVFIFLPLCTRTCTDNCSRQNTSKQGLSIRNSLGTVGAHNIIASLTTLTEKDFIDGKLHTRLMPLARLQSKFLMDQLQVGHSPGFQRCPKLVPTADYVTAISSRRLLYVVTVIFVLKQPV
jgi:hypothetical protein